MDRGADGEVIVEEDIASAMSEPAEPKPILDDNVMNKSSDSGETNTGGSQKPSEWVEWRENSDSRNSPPPSNSADADQTSPLEDGDVQMLSEEPQPFAADPDKTNPSSVSAEKAADSCETLEVNSDTSSSPSAEDGDGDQNVVKTESHTVKDDSTEDAKSEGIHLTD